MTEIENPYTKKAMDLIYEIVYDVARFRLPGSEDEQKAQQFLEKKIKLLGADETEVQNFYCRPKFFRWWPTVTMIIFWISIIVFNISPLLSVLLTIFSLINVILKLLSFTFLDVLFRKRPCSNVIGKLKSNSESSAIKTKRILIFGGHTDSTYEFPLGRKYGMKMIYFYGIGLLITFIWIITALVQLIIDTLNGIAIISLDRGLNLSWYYFLNIGLGIVLSIILWNIVSGRPVPGANDNLSGLAVAAMILNYFSEHPDEKPKDLELWAVFFGAEEGGMAGSKYMAKEMKKLIDSGNSPAEEIYVVNFDSIAADGILEIASKEPMYRATHDENTVNLLAESAKSANVEYVVKSLAAGTDSAPFSRCGIPAVGAVIMAKGGTPAYWHCREDTPENCNPKGIEVCIKTGIQLVKSFL